MNSLGHPGRVAIVAHDAGGAEILASLVKKNKILDTRFVLAGPAERIFNQRLGEVPRASLSEALQVCDWVLTGTGWQTDFEWQAIKEGRAAGRFVVSFLDHWVNYKERFSRNGITCYPDEIWVGDEYARELAKRVLPELHVCQVENPYFSHFANDVAFLESPVATVESKKKRILYVCENINRDGFHQNDAIRYFMQNVDTLRIDIAEILIRPHPSETADKYEWVAREFGSDVRLSSGVTLAKDVAASDIVVGCSSMAMALAVMVGRQVISCIPEEKIPLTLPFEKIERLSEIIKINSDATDELDFE